MRLIEAAESYILEQNLCLEYAAQIRHRMRLFAAHADVSDLEAVKPDHLNRWLAHLDGTMAPKTLKAYRACILAVWRWAWENRLTEVRPERIRRVRVPQSAPVAWTVDEIRRIVAVAEKLHGPVKHTEIAKRFWFTAFVRTMFCTGLRLGDLLKLRWDDVRHECSVITQNKTGRSVCHVLTPRTIAALDRLPRDGELVFPWPGARRCFFEQFEAIVQRAGVRPGTSRWLRRSGASYVEKESPGMASRFLGHATPGLAARHYIDPTITQTQAVRPPEL